MVRGLPINRRSVAHLAELIIIILFINIAPGGRLMTELVGNKKFATQRDGHLYTHRKTNDHIKYA